MVEPVASDFVDIRRRSGLRRLLRSEVLGRSDVAYIRGIHGLMAGGRGLRDRVALMTVV